MNKYITSLMSGKIRWFSKIRKISSINSHLRNSRYLISSNPFVDWTTVKSFPDFEWDWTMLSSNPNITWQIVLAEPDKPWSYELLSANPNITLDIIKQHPEFNWCYCELSRNPTVTWQTVLDNPDIPWSYEHLLLNPNITWQIVKKNLDKDWTCGFIGKTTSLNPSLTWVDVGDGMLNDFTYDIGQLSKHKCVTWSIVKKSSLDWSFRSMIGNPNITWQIVLANPDLFKEPWNFTENPNITWEIVGYILRKYPDKMVCMSYLYTNPSPHLLN